MLTFFVIWLVGAALSFYVGERGIMRMHLIGTQQAVRGWIRRQRWSIAKMSLSIWPVCLLYAAFTWCDGKAWARWLDDDEDRWRW